MEEIIRVLKEEFQKALESDEIPVAAIITDQAGNVIVKSTNERQKTYKICSHAEINAINKLFQINKSKNLKGYKLYSTMEPCKMCAGAIEQTGLNDVTFFVKNDKFGGSKIVDPRIKFTKIDSPDSKYFEEKVVEYFRKLR